MKSCWCLEENLPCKSILKNILQFTCLKLFHLAAHPLSQSIPVLPVFLSTSAVQRFFQSSPWAYQMKLVPEKKWRLKCRTRQPKLLVEDMHALCWEHLGRSHFCEKYKDLWQIERLPAFLSELLEYQPSASCFRKCVFTKRLHLTSRC